MVKELVQKLATGTHPVALGGAQTSLQDFQRRVKEMGYVFIQFTDTRGGTNLGVRVDMASTDLSNADFATGTGTAHIEGTLTLDYVHVRCAVDIDLATRQGTGRLLILEEVHP
ncbi:MAG TPA: hypothetical protein VJ761_13830 [Ktedonobacteraceae bacterium]|nr:hypothetical protein [Ktedonobacteraceae bacterium]